jgi:hypothetical protein
METNNVKKSSFEYFYNCCVIHVICAAIKYVNMSMFLSSMTSMS